MGCTRVNMGRRVFKKVETNNAVTSNLRFLYRGYLQIAALDLTRATQNAMWLITWDPTDLVATRPLAIQQSGTWYTYGLDLPKNVTELYGTNGYIVTAYTYSPYGLVIASGSVTQPIQWSSEFSDKDLGMVYYNYRHYNPLDGRWTGRDISSGEQLQNLYEAYTNTPDSLFDRIGLNVWIENGTSAFTFHQRVCVDDWSPKKGKNPCCRAKKQGKYCISFAARESSGRGSSSASNGSSRSSGSHGSSSDSSNALGNRHTASGSGKNSSPYNQLALEHGVFPDGMNTAGNLAQKNGEVYQDTQIKTRYWRSGELKTDCKIDMEVYYYFESLLGLQANYRFYSQNCRAFSWSVLNYIRRELEKAGFIKDRSK